MVKNSFSLLETILSVVVLSILLVNFNSYFSNNSELNNLSSELNLIENRFDNEDYSSFSKNSQNITVIVDNKNKEIVVDKYFYKNENLEILKYD